MASSSSSQPQQARFKSRFSQVKADDIRDDDDDDENENLLSRDRRRDEEDSLLEQEIGEGEGAGEAGRKVRSSIPRHDGGDHPEELISFSFLPLSTIDLDATESTFDTYTSRQVSYPSV